MKSSKRMKKLCAELLKGHNCSKTKLIEFYHVYDTYRLDSDGTIACKVCKKHWRLGDYLNWQDLQDLEECDLIEHLDAININKKIDYYINNKLHSIVLVTEENEVILRAIKRDLGVMT